MAINPLELALLIWTAFLVSVIEIYYWEQVIKKKVTIFPAIKGYNTYWAVHPLLLAVPIFLLTYSITKTLSTWFLYGLLEDVFYFKIAQGLGSDVSYATQTWMPVFKLGKYRIPIYYPIYLALGSILYFL